MVDLDLEGYYGDLHVGDLPQTKIFTYVWKEKIREVNLEFQKRIREHPYGGIRIYPAQLVVDDEGKKCLILNENKVNYIVFGNRRLENESRVDIVALNNSEMAHSMEMGWNADDLDKEHRTDDFIGTGFNDRPQLDPEDPYTAYYYLEKRSYSKYDREIYYKQFGRGKVVRIPKRYRYSSGKDGMEGFKDCECTMCWDKKEWFQRRKERLLKALQNSNVF